MKPDASLLPGFRIPFALKFAALKSLADYHGRKLLQHRERHRSHLAMGVQLRMFPPEFQSQLEVGLGTSPLQVLWGAPIEIVLLL